MATIKNIWKEIEVYCGNGHNELVKMEIQQGPHSLFYACPKYHPENRTKDERACANRINLIDYEKMINHISDILIEAEMNDVVENLTGHSWSANGIDFKIISDDDKIRVLMLSKKSLARDKR